MNVGSTTYSTGTISTSGSNTTINGSGTSWNSSMVGGTIYFRDSGGTYRSEYIVSVSGATTLTIGTARTVSASTSYVIVWGGIRTSNTGAQILQNTVDSTSAFSIQNASNTKLLNADTTNMRITIGGASGSLSGRALEVTSVDITTTLRVGDGTNGISFNDQTSGKLRFRGTAQNDISLTLSPEYAGAVLTGDGSNNVGTMTSDFCSGSSLLNIGTSCGASEDHNFYSWTANATNDYDIYVKWKVPSDFASFAATPMQLYGWKTGAGDTVQVRVYKSGSSTVCDNDSLSSSGSWALVTSDPTTSCSISAGDDLVFRITLIVATNGNYARAGEIFINYKSQF